MYKRSGDSTAIHQFVSKQIKQFPQKSISKMKYFALLALLAVIVAAVFAEPRSMPKPDGVPAGSKVVTSVDDLP